MPEQKAETKVDIQHVSDDTETVLFSWTARSRPFKKLPKEKWMRIIIFCAFFGLILFIAEGLVPVLLTIALVFFFYVLLSIEPTDIQYKLTTKGIRISENLTIWSQIRSFYFDKSLGSDVLVLDTNSFVPRLNLVINPSKLEEIRKVLVARVPESTPVPTNIDKASSWFSKKILGN